MKEVSEKEFEELGLENCRKLIFRGEDIPSLVEKFNKEGKKCIGLTGKDLFTEYLLRKQTNLTILKTIEWDYPSNLFGKPTLCFLLPKGKKVDGLKGKIRVAVNAKYYRIATNFLAALKRKDVEFKLKYFAGETEQTVKEGLTDACIEIVYSGKSAEENGLYVAEKVFESDLVLIGDTDDSGN